MTLVRHDPFRALREWENRYFADAHNKEGGISAFMPSVNTREDEKAYYIEVDIPGLKKEDIAIDVRDGLLHISGERKFKNEVKKEDYYKVESQYGRFERSFTLSDKVAAERIEAGYENGVLELTLPKAEPQVAKKIEIK